MSQQTHLFSLRLFNAFRESCIKQPYTKKRFSRDVIAGITVGIIAIPLAMALAIASGVPPQNGLYTAMIAGFVIALTGGSRFSVSGPTAAFVVILYPVAQKFGLPALLVATIMGGVIMVIMALLRLGRLIEYISESVTVGFTSGIAIVLATLQFKDVFGLPIASLPDAYTEKIVIIINMLPHAYWPSVLVAVLTLLTLIYWPRLKIPITGYLPAVGVGTIVSILLQKFGFRIDTIGSRFHYVQPNGEVGQGIPPFFPNFNIPWLNDGWGTVMPVWSWNMIETLLPIAFSIAILGAIESLLCAVVLDNMMDKKQSDHNELPIARHSANSELLAQGIGNIVTPFFGGITATAAIARSVANLKAGAESPVSAMVHAIVVLLGLVALSSCLSYLPMASMSALLLMVAWKMSDAAKAFYLIRKSPLSDIAVFLVCFLLTILVDMATAISIGILLASLLFMREMAAMTKVTDVTHTTIKRFRVDLLPGWRVIKINGPLFFAAADRVFGELSTMTSMQNGLVLYMDAVSILDAGGLAAMHKFLDKCGHSKVQVIFADFQEQPLRTLYRAGISDSKNVKFLPTLESAVRQLENKV